MKENRNTHKGFKVFLIVFVIFALVFIKEENQQKAIDIFNAFRNNDKELKLNRLFEIEDKERFFYFNGSITKWDDNIITFLDSEGSTLWNKEFSFLEPQVITTDENIYVMDKSSGDVYLLDNKGNTISRIQLNTSIFNLKEDNNQILVHIKDDNKEKLNIIDKDGKELLSLQMNNILTYSVDKDMYLISNLEIEEGGLTSMVNISSIKGEKVDKIPFPNEVIIFSQIVNDKVIILTDKSLNLIENNNIIWSENYPLVKDILIEKGKIYLLYGDNIEIINSKGEIEKKITFGLDYKNMIQIGNYITLYGDRDILMLQNGEERLKYKTEEDIMNINGNNNQIAFIYLNKLEIYDIINKE